MVHCKVEDLYKTKYAVLWSVLSFKAGLLNASGFLAAGQYVSHVTGFGTQIGLAIGHDDFVLAPILFLVPIAFILGASLPAWILDMQYDKNKIPMYPLVQGLITLLLGIIAWMAATGHFGNVSDEIHDMRDLELIALLCLTCGLKNGLTTWATHGKIRTTHLTGLSTDIGLHLPKFLGMGKNSRYPEKKAVNVVRIITLFSFFFGSCISAIIFPQLHYYTFIAAFIMSVGLLSISIINYVHHTQKITHVILTNGGINENTVEINATRTN